MKFYRKFSFLLALVFFFCTGNFAIALSIPHEQYTLANGLKVLLSVDKSSPFVAVNIWYAIGSVHEKENKTGLAHLFEHLMFEGSKHVPDDGHFRYLESAGAFHFNASTSFYRTNYYQTVPKEYLSLVLALESSRMSFLDLTESKLLEQKEVVRREREQRYETRAYGVATLSLWESIFAKGHPFRGRVIGSHEDLQSASLNDVKDFYNTYYGPQNATLAIVGNFELTEAKALIEKYFAGLKPKNNTANIAITPPKFDGEQIIKAEERLGKVPFVRLMYSTPAFLTKDDALMDIIAHGLTGTESSILSKALLRDEILAESVQCYQQSMKDFSFFNIDIVLAPNIEPNTVIAKVDKVLTDINKNGFDQKVITGTKNKLLTSQLFSLQEIGGTSGKAETLQTYMHHVGKADYLTEDLARFKEANEKSVHEAIKKYLPVKNNRVVLVAEPSNKAK